MFNVGNLEMQINESPPYKIQTFCVRISGVWPSANKGLFWINMAENGIVQQILVYISPVKFQQNL
jgi:hypothetical protein